jgi:hypothetical protein
MLVSDGDDMCTCGAPATTVTPGGTRCDDCARALALHLQREGEA